MFFPKFTYILKHNVMKYVMKAFWIMKKIFEDSQSSDVLMNISWM